MLQVGPSHVRGASAIQADLSGLGAGFWVAHGDRRAAGVTKLELKMERRHLRLTVTEQIDPAQLSGREPVALCFDDIRNRGALPDRRSSEVPGLPYADHSGKGQVKVDGTALVGARTPLLMFVAFGDTGRVDVLNVETGRRLRSIEVPGVVGLASYFSQ
jgi:hypothetical protein